MDRNTEKGTEGNTFIQKHIVKTTRSDHHTFTYLKRSEESSEDFNRS